MAQAAMDEQIDADRIGQFEELSNDFFHERYVFFVLIGWV
jgi:hypothetical protein